MYLLIDVTILDEIKLTLFDASYSEHKMYSGKNREILFFVEQFLTLYDKTADDVQGIAVILGEGGFTSTRLATTLANTWVYAKGITAVGIKKEQADDFSALCDTLRRTPKGVYISAMYSGEPHIGR